jgi:hypothetical protein
MVELVARSAVRRVRLPAHASILIPLGIFVFTRLVDVVLVLVMQGDQAARVGNPEMKVVDPAPASPGYLAMLTNWDGQWYQEIAEHGYPDHLPREDGQVIQNPWAFFPLYPALVRAVMALSSLSFPIVATLVSTAAGAAAMVLLFRMLEPTVGRFHASMSVLALSMYPAALLFQAAYTESLALLLLLGCLYLLRERSYRALAVLVVLLSLTRAVAAPMALVVLAHGLLRWHRRGTTPLEGVERRRWAVAAAVSLGSVGLWPAICAIWTRDLSGFLATQQAWAAVYPGWPTWLSAILHEPLGGAGLLALVAFSAACVVVVRRGARSWGEELRLWVPLYGLYLLSTCAPVASCIRYAMLAVVPWWPFADRDRLTGRTERLVALTLVVVLGVLAQVVWLRHFYVIGPDYVMSP